MSLKIVPSFKVTPRISEGVFIDPTEISLRQLRDVVAGRESAFPRTQAMALLFDSDFPNKHRDFEAVLENERETTEIRYLAATYLGRVNTASAVEILIRNSQIRDEYVLAGVMKALGRIGDRLALEAVMKAKEEAKGLAVLEAKFAAVLISHRINLEGNAMSIPDNREYLELPADCARPLHITRADDIDAEFCLRSVAGQPLGIEFLEHPMYQFRCGRRTWMILFNRDCVGQDTVKKLTKQKSLFGVLAIRSEETRLYSVALLLLISPDEQKDTANILICRTNGDLAFGGTAQVKGDHAEFSIRAVSRPGAFAVRVEGAFENDRLEIKEALSTPFALVKKRQPMDERNENIGDAAAFVT